MCLPRGETGNTYAHKQVVTLVVAGLLQVHESVQGKVLLSSKKQPRSRQVPRATRQDSVGDEELHPGDPGLLLLARVDVPRVGGSQPLLYMLYSVLQERVIGVKTRAVLDADSS